MKSEPESSADACPLSERAQTRNVLLIGAITGINYLSAPTTYLWIHAPLCKRLGADATVANLPSTAYYAFAVTPLLVSWAFPSPALFKRIMALSNALFAAMCAVVVAALLLPLPDNVKIGVLILHGAVTGATLTTSVAILFEVLGRGVSVARRGQALGLAYGVGPMFAALASGGLQLVLPEKGADSDGWLEFPWNYATEFAVSVPIMSLVAYLCSLCVIPPDEAIVHREPFAPWLSGGVRGFLGDRVIRWTTILAVLMFCGYHIGDNMALYTRYSMDSMPERYLGFQQFFRYGFKILSGFLLGWLLTTTNPKVVLLVSASFGLTGILWALMSSGYWYLVSFGFVGAGELFGPYVTNYILACSPAAQMRRNMAFTILLMFPAAAAGPLFGGIADVCGAYGFQALGYQLSFAASAAFISAAILMMLPLPARPRPEEPELTKPFARTEEAVS